MRTLLLFRGAPGCGKSTYIDNHGLRPYALSADDIRLQCQSAQQNIYGEEEISQSNDKLVWKILFDLLETRMSKGEFTVIDATNSKTSEMNQYKKLAQDYRYRVYLIDFTDLPIEECKRRNAQRISLKRVPEAVIDKMYARFQNQSVPSMITVIKPDELNKIFYHRIDLSQYDKIVHIGDIHGCNTALQDYFKEHPFSDNNFYIFVGDYIDRGIENAEVLKFLFTLINKKNVLFLEGNHERWLWYYAHDKASKSREFEFGTLRQLEEAGIDKKDIRIFYRKLAQCAWYTYKEKEVFVTHGGVATLPENLTTMATEQMIKGVGRYGDYETVADTWMSTTKNNQYEVFGHRNIKHLPIELRDRVMCLEGQIEFGGDLRVTELDATGFHSIYVKNTVFRTPEASKVLSEKEDSSVANAVMKFRANPKYIEEKNFGSISSFHVIAIGKEYDEKDVPDHIYFGLDEFGWKVDTYKDITSRASYLYTAICYNNSYIKARNDYIDYISETLGEQGITCEFEDPSEREFFSIDHVEDLRDWLKDLREDKSKLLMYLLSPDSEIRTGNDNGDSELKTDDLENNDNVELYWE